jgi:hypothetical protein
MTIVTTHYRYKHPPRKKVSVRPQTCSGATAEDGRFSPLEPPSVAPEGAVDVGK